MVLAAGLGLRMRPLTLERPKPLLGIAGSTLLGHALHRLAATGVTDAVVNCHYKAEMVAAYLADWPRPRIRLAPEPMLLETGGGVKAALPHLGTDPFFVVNADILWTDGAVPALRRLSQAWRDDAMDALLLLMPVASSFGYAGRGDYRMAEDGRLARRAKDEAAPHVYAGVQITAGRAFDGSPDGAFSNNLVWDRAERAGRLFGLVHDGGWYHIGTPEALAEARLILEPVG